MNFFLENLPAIITLVIGFALVVLEMYIPGFGAPGILGGLLLVIGIYLTAQSVMQAFIMVVILIILLLIAFFICLRSASKGRLSKSRLVLNEVISKQDSPSGEDLSYFVGKEGVARTVLRPAGIADFDGVKLNVVSDGDFIAIGKNIRIERIEGNRIVVIELK